MKIDRRFSRPGSRPLEDIDYEKRNTRILNSDGSLVFEVRDAWVPKAWSRLASDILVSKYFRKAGVPQRDADGALLKDDNGKPVLGPEKHVRQVVDRMASCWRQWGERGGFFDTPEDGENFQAELEYMLIHQHAAPNSPQWFNTGLHDSYGIVGPAQGHYFFDPEIGQVVKAPDSYSRPQPHACFIQAVDDNLVNAGGIMDLWTREARLFKYGSGTGTNFSRIRGEGEPLAGGGVSSGLMSFLKIGDRAAGAIKSGGTTRRAAKMVCLDLDHPDIEEFVSWKAEEEKKAKAMIEAGYDADFNGEAYQTVSGQNSNNSVRIPSNFIRALEVGGDWNLTWRTDGRVSKTLKAQDLMDLISKSAWECADPGVQYEDTINEWHTCPAGGRIEASNPCSEYMFLNDTACNLASLNLKKFYDEATGKFDLEALRHAVRLWTLVLEISVGMASYPSKEIAVRSYEFRTIGLGHANIGSLLMTMGIPYDSPEGRAIAGGLTAVLTGESYATSAEMAREVGAFPRYQQNRKSMLRVIRNHRRASYDRPQEAYEDLTVKPMGIDPGCCLPDLLEAARSAWDRAVELGENYGFRNAQASVIAPTGTIGLLMDCDTTGVEPDFSLVKLKKLAGGGVFKIVNQTVGSALTRMGYTADQTKAILTHVVGTGTLRDAPGVSRARLLAKGLLESEVDQIDVALASAFDLAQAVSPNVVGEEAMRRLGFEPEHQGDSDFDLLDALAFTREDISKAEDYACGHGTVEGALELREEHLPVFDCANRCGKNGKRFIHYMGHVKMMAATQSFVSGAISKTINMPGEVDVKDIEEAFLQGWNLGLKAIALYRDGCKSSQPLNVMGDGNKKSKTRSNPGSSQAGSSQAGSSQMMEETEEETEAPPFITPQVGPALQPIRRRLPKRRMGFTQEARVGGTKVYLRTGEYEDGTLGEIFIDLAKEGAAFRSMMNCFAISVSLGLQHGVPLKEFVDCFTFTRFEPQGRVTSHPNIKMATSVVDYIFRVLDLEYHGNTDLVHVKPGELEKETREVAARQESAPTASAPRVPHVPVEFDEGGASESIQELSKKVPESSPMNPEDRNHLSGEPGGSPLDSKSENKQNDLGSKIETDMAGGNGNQGTTLPTGGKPDAPSLPTAPFLQPPWEIAPQIQPQPGEKTRSRTPGASTSVMDEHFGGMMGDAPFCDVCGHITVRNGSCYRCLNCGNSMGCS